MALLSSLAGLLVAASVLVGGIYALIRLILKVGVWTNTVSRALAENTASNKDLTGKVQTISSQLERYDRDIHANRERIERIEREHLEQKWHNQHWPSS